MRTTFGLLSTVTMGLLLACTSGGGDDTGGSTSAQSDPSGDPGGDPSTAGTGSATEVTPTGTDPSAGTVTMTDPSGDPTGDPSGDPTTDSSETTDTGTTDPTAEPGPLVEPGDPGPGDVTFTIRADEDRHPISKHIYGSNQPGFLTGMGLVRQGGNRMTAYNWENNASNAGADYMHQNDGFLETILGVDGDKPGSVVGALTEQTLDVGADMMVTIPICGYVAADKDGGGDVNQTPNYLQTRFHPTIAAKGAAFADPPDLEDGKVYQDEFVAWLKSHVPEGFSGDRARVLFSMDNEPDLWNSTHPRIHPANVGYAELAQKNREFARAVKAVAPNALVTGMVSYGFAGYQSLQDAPDKMGNAIDYYLAQMKKAEDEEGLRLIDVLDLHWYTEVYANGQRITGEDTSPDSVAARVQAPRSLWDPAYQENSWIANDVLQGPVQLIPWLRAKIDANYPGTLIGFTEYNYGGGGHISGGIAQVDVLGIFGREGVAVGAYWDLGGAHTYIDAAFRVFVDFNGVGARFGDTSIRAITSDVERTSVYASVDAGEPGRTVIVAINKTGAPLTAAVALAAYADYASLEVWQLGEGGPNLAEVPAPALADTNAFVLPMPAYSVSVVVPRE